MIKDLKPIISKTTGRKALLDIANDRYSYYNDFTKLTVVDIPYFIPPTSKYAKYNKGEYHFDLTDNLRSMDITEGIDISSKDIEDYKAGNYNQNSWIDDENYISNYIKLEVQPGQKIHFESGLPFKQINFFNYNGTYLGDNQSLFNLTFDEQTTEGTVELFSGIKYVSFTMIKDEDLRLAMQIFPNGKILK